MENPNSFSKYLKYLYDNNSSPLIKQSNVPIFYFKGVKELYFRLYQVADSEYWLSLDHNSLKNIFAEIF